MNEEKTRATSVIGGTELLAALNDISVARADAQVLSRQLADATAMINGRLAHDAALQSQVDRYAELWTELTARLRLYEARQEECERRIVRFSEEHAQLRIDFDMKIQDVSEQNILLKEDNRLLRSGAGSPNVSAEPLRLESIDTIFNAKPFDQKSLPGSTTTRYTRHLIMPIHPPKISHISNIFSRLEGIQDVGEEPLWTLVATSRSEREMIEQYIDLTKPKIPASYEVVSALEICELLGFSDLKLALTENRDGGIINIKKFLAIYRAMCLGALEICCIDSDVIFLDSPSKLFDVAQNNYSKKIFIGGNSPIDITRAVVDSCAGYFSEHDKFRLKSIMGTNLFSWFFDVPYYANGDLQDFFAHLQYLHGGLERALSKLSWHHFDHVLYLSYLILRGDFQIVDVTSLIGPDRISDGLFLSDLLAVWKRHEYLPAWIPLLAMVTSEEPSLPDFVLTYHVDRIQPTF